MTQNVVKEVVGGTGGGGFSGGWIQRSSASHQISELVVSDLAFTHSSGNFMKLTLGNASQFSGRFTFSGKIILSGGNTTDTDDLTITFSLQVLNSGAVYSAGLGGAWQSGGSAPITVHTNSSTNLDVVFDLTPLGGFDAWTIAHVAELKLITVNPDTQNISVLEAITFTQRSTNEVSGGANITADIGIDTASQLEAETGTDNVKGMTPLRTAQAIAALGGSGGGGAWDVLVDQADLSGLTVYDLGLDSAAQNDGYKAFKVIYRAEVPTSTTMRLIGHSPSGQVIDLGFLGISNIYDATPTFTSSGSNDVIVPISSVSWGGGADTIMGEIDVTYLSGITAGNRELVLTSGVTMTHAQRYKRMFDFKWGDVDNSNGVALRFFPDNAFTTGTVTVLGRK